MTQKYIADKPLSQWIQRYPILKTIMAARETLWLNPLYGSFQQAGPTLPFAMTDITDAENRLERFAPYIARVFPETAAMQGIIESPLVPAPTLQQRLGDSSQKPIPGTLLLKCDSHLPISGSIKARGGIYEVLKHAESLAFSHGLLTATDDYATIDSDRFRKFFSQYTLTAGSTGNLGLSIGIMGACMGFKVCIHMSRDAKQWKKDLLNDKGVTVVEHQTDYSLAVIEGRKQAKKDPYTHFIDDEQSEDLFLGYSVAALRLVDQLQALNISVDAAHPLFVYLPCGVGGGPGGLTLGLKHVFRDHVHCFFAEPTASACMLTGLVTGLHDRVSVHDFGLDNNTDADGLAVGRPSGFVGKTLQEMISGIYTVDDATLYRCLQLTHGTENLCLEPSALAGMPGPAVLTRTHPGKTYLEQQGLKSSIANATHIVWATGGNMVPASIMQDYLNKQP